MRPSETNERAAKKFGRFIVHRWVGMENRFGGDRHRREP